MSDLLGSNEFGDWLLAEIAEACAQVKAADSEQSRNASLRCEALKVAKVVLFEFLLIQQQMLNAARAAQAP
jgi:hypothetical protein